MTGNRRVMRKLFGIYRKTACRLVALTFAASLAPLALASTLPGESPKEKYPGDKTFMLRVQLTDKLGTPYTLSRPYEFLSRKSLERRQRQDLRPDSTDLPVSPVYEKAVEREGCRVVSRSKWNNTLLVSTQDSTAARRIATLKGIASVRLVWTSPDSINKRRPRPKYHKELLLRDTTIQCPQGETAEQLRMVGLDKLHAHTFRGEGMTIAVLDAGFLNADLIPALKNINLKGFADFVCPPSRNIFAESEHGTQVLSVMAANVPGVYVGSAPDAAYWLLRCEDQQTEQPVEEDYWAAAAEYADSVGADIINSSLGFHSFDNPADNYRYAQQDGNTALISRTASMLARKGIVLVSSCGNDGMTAWKKINFPADASDILAVGAVTPQGRNAGFSSLGPTADGRVKPDVMAQGSPTTVISERGTVSSDIGTSFAAPIITGLVACLWQQTPTLSATQIMQLIRQHGDNSLTPDNVYGYGIPRF